jgi:2,4-diaminopentanoate dehydrogenase
VADVMDGMGFGRALDFEPMLKSPGFIEMAWKAPIFLMAGALGGRRYPRSAIVIEHIIRISRDVAPDWPESEFDATYRVDIDGDPDIHCAMTPGEAQGRAAGQAAMAGTAMWVVNAIPYVVEAPAGLLSSLDIPNTLPRYVFD